MIGDNCPAWMVITGSNFSPTMPSESSNLSAGQRRKEYMRAYARKKYRERIAREKKEKGPWN